MRLPQFTRSIRFRLTVWYSSLLLVFGVAFVVALNLAVRLDQRTLFEATPSDIIYQPQRIGPGQGLVFIAETGQPVTLRQVEDDIFDENLDRLQFWSILSVLGLALASGVGGYVLSGMMLRPVRDITDAASEIGATNLNRRINYEGPEDELFALAKTFDSMIERLEASFERQRQLVQDASHELRTPLAAIKTNIEVTEMDPDATVDDYRELLATIKAQTDRLTRLSEDLLLLTNGDDSSIEREEVELSTLAHEVVRQLTPLAATRDVTLEVNITDGSTCTTSPDLLFRCVLNLVDNAIKYSGEGSHVVVTVGRDGPMATIKVADNGVGIDPESLARVFDRFYRVDKGRSRREGGTGLGLSIVKQLVESLGGRVTVESEVGKGTTFTIHLPADEI